MIPFEKLMQSFELYPHDPNRGVDIVSTPIFYKQSSSKLDNYNVKYTENLLVLIPYPDMSMPFNIITFTMALFGYFYLSVYLATTKKESESKTE